MHPRYLSHPKYHYPLIPPSKITSLFAISNDLKLPSSHSPQNHVLYDICSSVSSNLSSSFFPTTSLSTRLSLFSLHFCSLRTAYGSFFQIRMLRSDFRLFSASSDAKSTKKRLLAMRGNEFGERPSKKQIFEIIDAIRSGRSDLASKLNSMNARLSVDSVAEILWGLNRERVSGRRFFSWIRGSWPEIYSNYGVCSLVVYNCGSVGDYEGMSCLLREFRSKRVCLTKNAFEFLLIYGSNERVVMDSVRRIISILGEVGGSCCSTGIRALIEMFSSLGSFEMARMVMQITERSVPYYNIMVLEMSKKGNSDEAVSTLKEMQQWGCYPNAKTYNYLLSCLCKNGRTSEAWCLMKDMMERDCPVDSITFEIFISHFCGIGQLDMAIEVLSQMVFRDIEPRHTTHGALIKGYFDSGQYQEAYNYVVDSRYMFRFSSNMMYTLLFSLHQRHGNAEVAYKVITEMMEKDLKPNYGAYMRVLKLLRKSGKRHLAVDLEIRFSRFRLLNAENK